MYLDFSIRYNCYIKMEKFLFRTFIIKAFLFCLAVSDKWTWNQTTFNQRVVDFISDGLKCHYHPGFSVAVVKDGKVVLTKGFGYKTLDKTDPVTENTLFGIASLTKAFSATLILKQIEENDTDIDHCKDRQLCMRDWLSLSTTLRSLLGRDNIFNSELRSKYATLEDLLAHKIGLPHHNGIRFDDKLTRNNLIDRIKYLNETDGFRTSFNYSNLMYGLVTYISEILGGKSWEELIREKIFSPLEMTSSTFSTKADPKYLDLATGYEENDYGGELIPVPFEFSRRWGELCGSGCILSNAVDMSKWMLFHLNNKKHVKYETVLKSESLMEAHTLHNYRTKTSRAPLYVKPRTPVTISESNYGLGWDLGYYRGFPMWTHSGSTFGYASLITLLPNRNIGVFTTMTIQDPQLVFRTNVHAYIADLALGLQPWMNSSTVCSFPEPWYHKSPKVLKERPKTNIHSSRLLDEYTGMFRNPAYGFIDVYKNKTSGFLMAKHGFAQYILYPKSSTDHFYADGFGLLKNLVNYPAYIFTFDENEVRNLTIPDFESNNPPVFRRMISTQERSLSSHSENRTICTFEIVVLMILCFLHNVNMW